MLRGILSSLLLGVPLLLLATTSPAAPADAQVGLFRRPVLSYSGDIAEATPRELSFVVPDYPQDGREYDAKLHVRYRWNLIVGGQNRSSAPHPGLPLNVFDGTITHLYWTDAATVSDTPWEPYSPGVLAGDYFVAYITDWGATSPAPHPSQWVQPGGWEAAYEAGDASVYWGPSVPFDVPFSEPEYLVNTYGLDVEPGQVVTGKFYVNWLLQSWPAGHQWAFWGREFVHLDGTFEWVPRIQ